MGMESPTIIRGAPVARGWVVLYVHPWDGNRLLRLSSLHTEAEELLSTLDLMARRDYWVRGIVRMDAMERAALSGVALWGEIEAGRARKAGAKALPVPAPGRCPNCDGMGYWKASPSGDYQTCSSCKGTGREVASDVVDRVVHADGGGSPGGDPGGDPPWGPGDAGDPGDDAGGDGGGAVPPPDEVAGEGSR